MKQLVLITALLICSLFVMAKTGTAQLGEEAPEFTAQTTNGTLNFPSDFGNSWKILFSHPQDFTPVCTSEILKLADMQQDFKELNCELAIISTDLLSQHKSWKQSIEDIVREGKENVKIEFPIIEDEKAFISRKYGMIHGRVSTTKDVRGVFIIDDKNVVQSINYYPMNLGRNMDEIKRMVVALQTSDKEKVLMPANWNVGDDVLVPYKPYSEEALAKDPKIADDFYNVGISMWYKKSN